MRWHFPDAGLRIGSVGSLALSGHTRRVNRAIDAKTHASRVSGSIDAAMSPRQARAFEINHRPRYLHLIYFLCGYPNADVWVILLLFYRLGIISGHGDRLNLH